MYLVLGIIGTLLALLILAVVFVIKNKQKRASWLIQHLQLLKTARSRIPKVNMSSVPILISFVPEKPAYTELSSPQGTTEHLNQKRHHQNNNTQSTDEIFKEHFPESNSIPFSNGHSVGKSQI
ncbi:hypothetical protein XELAEV_18040688mg [Xenopus laevis]|uniref:Uncharacterized protein n=1 Tax=Xenopus laevis TaxID=8355 RepID=A0A974CA63_XENLA|nr:hypothetical protein XELAEV_18040688mg [Xenopus laevis]